MTQPRLKKRCAFCGKCRHFLFLLAAEGWSLGKQKGWGRGSGELLGKKTGKCTRNIVYMSLLLKFKRNRVHIQFHILLDHVGNFPYKCFLNRWSHAGVRIEQPLCTELRFLHFPKYSHKGQSRAAWLKKYGLVVQPDPRPITETLPETNRH